MRSLTLLFISLAFASICQSVEKPASHTAGTQTGTPSGPLKPGEYWWNPQLSPTGPVVALVSIPEQTMHVYRNGILIGRSTVSTGSKGHATPGGVFSILEKRPDHHSKKYNNAPMPFTLRLTREGVAIHGSPVLNGYASHGCIGVPDDFAAKLFAAAKRGDKVIITRGKMVGVGDKIL